MTIIDLNHQPREVKSVKPDPSFPGFLLVDYGRRTDWYSVTEFLSRNPTLEHLLKGAADLPAEICGVVTSSSDNSLTDTTQKWLENSYTNFYLWISRGKGEGQKRIITSNNHNTASIDKPWETKPDKTSQYVFSHDNNDHAAMGNTLPQVEQVKLEELSRKIDLKKGILRPKEYYHPTPTKKKKS